MEVSKCSTNAFPLSYAEATSQEGIYEYSGNLEYKLVTIGNDWNNGQGPWVCLWLIKDSTLIPANNPGITNTFRKLDARLCLEVRAGNK